MVEVEPSQAPDSGALGPLSPVGIGSGRQALKSILGPRDRAWKRRRKMPRGYRGDLGTGPGSARGLPALVIGIGPGRLLVSMREMILAAVEDAVQLGTGLNPLQTLVPKALDERVLERSG